MVAVMTLKLATLILLQVEIIYNKFSVIDIWLSLIINAWFSWINMWERDSIAPVCAYASLSLSLNEKISDGDPDPDPDP